MREFYCYVYLDPRKSGRFSYGDFVTFFYEPFYIGKGTKKRYLHHIKEKSSKNKHKFNKIKLIKEEYNLENYIIKLINSNNECCNCFEKFFINLIGRSDLNLGPLTNLTDGGEGSLNLKQSKEKLEKLSKIHKGKIISDEQKKIISEINKKRIYSDEHRRKIGEANSKRVIKESTREKHRQIAKNRTITEETRKKFSINAKRRREENKLNGITATL